MSDSVVLKKIHIEKWRQFEYINIDFHPKLTILTGANGSGKTTILNILSKHYGWNTQFVSLPKRQKSGLLKFFAIWDLFDKDNPNSGQNQTDIGEIEYNDGYKTQLYVNNEVGYSFEVYFRSQKPVNGFHVPSHRPVYFYQQVGTIPTAPKTKDAAFSEYFSVAQNRYINQYTHPLKSVNYVIKETLISFALFGEGNSFVIGNPEALETFNGFQEVLRLVLPPGLGFKKILIETPEVLLETKSGRFSLDSVSGGIASIIDLAWQIFMYSKSKAQCVVTIDEPENHLHPEMQKSLLTNLIKAFPNCQFIVSTHSPFIITSTPDSNVYALHYDNNNRVVSHMLDMVNKAGNSSDILRDVLGLENTFPLWVERRIQEITEKYLTDEITPEKLIQLKNEMSELGLGHLFPSAASQVLKGGE
jgi:predicted ATPase